MKVYTVLPIQPAGIPPRESISEPGMETCPEGVRMPFGTRDLIVPWANIRHAVVEHFDVIPAAKLSPPVTVNALKELPDAAAKQQVRGRTK